MTNQPTPPTDVQRTHLARAFVGLLGSAVLELQKLPAADDVVGMVEVGASTLVWRVEYREGRALIELQVQDNDGAHVTVGVWPLAVQLPGAELLPPAQGLQ